MSMKGKRKCRQCEEWFVLLPDKPGYAHDCPSCSDKDVPLLMAKVAWSGKHEMEMEITSDRKAAMAFNKAQRRNSATVMSSITQAREEPENTKQGLGAEAYAIYRSPLGEKHSVKGN